MEDTAHYETLLTSESLAGVRTFIHGGGVQLSCLDLCAAGPVSLGLFTSV